MDSEEVDNVINVCAKVREAIDAAESQPYVFRHIEICYACARYAQRVLEMDRLVKRALRGGNCG
ncbi:MAG: hypothetical protein HY318_08865 [Armatimonadetes bacterium]|nr:hypothetical protein [Armatimonadota bacterium]